MKYPIPSGSMQSAHLLHIHVCAVASSNLMRRIVAACSLAGLSSFAISQPVNNDEYQRRQEQQSQQERQRRSTPPVLTPPDPTAINYAVFDPPTETPCFNIKQVQLVGVQKLTFIPALTQIAQGRCLGAQGIRHFQGYLQTQLIKRGFNTSRVLLPNQNLSSGALTVQIIEGVVAQYKYEGVQAGQPAKLIGTTRLITPLVPGEVLNQRALDQTIENFRRLSSQSNVQIDLVPGSRLGETDIIIKTPDARRWRGLVSLDDSGLKSTGKAQLGATLTVDSPLYLYDSLTIQLNSNANASNDRLSSRATSVQWNVPVGFWSLSTGANYSTYKQTVAGFNTDIVYSGRTRGVELGVGVVPYRSASVRTQLNAKLARKENRSFIDDVEVQVQRRDIVGYEFGGNWRHDLETFNYELSGSIKGSLPKESKSVGFIAGVPNWNGRYELLTLGAQVNIPFTLGKQNLRYQATARAQHAFTPLPGSEQFSIGGRYSVRGFDGQLTLAAENGATLRQELTWYVNQNFETYAAADAGRIHGPATEFLLGQRLAGAAVGLRGRHKTTLGQLQYDVSVGAPISKPLGFKAKGGVVAATVSFEF